MTSPTHEPVRLDGEHTWVAALDVGGMSIKHGAVASDGSVRRPGRVALESQGSTAHLLEALTRAMTSAVEAAPSPVVAVSIAFPAPFDYANGIPQLTHKFASINGINLGAELRRRLDRQQSSRPLLDTLPPAFVFCNDAAAAGLGEAAFGQARTTKRALMITLGTGLGACLVERGAVLTDGASQDIPELYQQQLQEGKADDLFSARGLANRLSCSVDRLEERVNEARVEGTGQNMITQFGQDLGRFLAPYVEQTGAEVLIVGGGASGAFDLFGGSLTEAARCQATRASLGSDAALLGAYVNALGPQTA